MKVPGEIILWLKVHVALKGTWVQLKAPILWLIAISNSSSKVSQSLLTYMGSKHKHTCRQNIQTEIKMNKYNLCGHEKEPVEGVCLGLDHLTQYIFSIFTYLP